jgi:prepilin-type N-terminal cleavage/methylation domain-containing protein/prepilin-type processing-associated H-X9-DG protein
MSNYRLHTRAFTLIELLVVISIIVVLIGILVPGLLRARATARRTACGSNLHQVGIGVYAYASEYNGSIPFGPKAPPMSFFNFYPVTGNVTSLISLQSGEACGLGILLDRQLSNTPKVLFCPGNEQGDISDSQLASFGKSQAQCDYYYRHDSGADSYVESPRIHLQLSNLGDNSAGRPIRAMAMDVQFIADPALASLQIYTRTAHEGKWVNVLYSDGHVAALSNANARYTVDSRIYLPYTFGYILRALERADSEE